MFRLFPSIEIFNDIIKQNDLPENRMDTFNSFEIETEKNEQRKI